MAKKCAGDRGAQRRSMRQRKMFGGMGDEVKCRLSDCIVRSDALRIYEGATEVQQLIIARELLKDYKDAQA